MLSPGRALGRLAHRSAKRPLAVLAAAALLGAVCAVLALGLRPTAATDTFVGSSTQAYAATQRYYHSFGEEPVQVLVQGSLQKLLGSEDVDRLLGLEGCLSGRVPRKALASEGGVNGPCGRLSSSRAVKVVIGPATFISEAAEGIAAQLQRRRIQAEGAASAAQRYVEEHALEAGLSAAEARSLGASAHKANLSGFAAEVSALAVRYGLNGVPTINDPSFVSTLVFNSSAKLPGTPKKRFAYLFPSRDAALISVRLRAGLRRSVREQALSAIAAAVRMRQWQPREGERYLLTGEPLIVSQLTRSISRSILLLLIAVSVAMALALSLIFRGRPRLLPLAIALLSLLATFGVLDLAFGGTIGVGQLAVLPVLTGLAVDYAIQLHSRAQESLDADSGSVPEAVMSAARGVGPSLLAAAAASGGAILMLELSPVPTVQGFSTLLVIGIAAALLCTFTVGSAAIALAGRLKGRRGMHLRNPLARELKASWRGAEDLVLDNRLTRALFALAVQKVPSRPRRAILAGVALAAAGWGLSSLTPVQTDITKLVPQGMPSLRNLATLERLSGVGGEIDLMVSGPQLTSPRTLGWMERYQSGVLKRFGSSANGACGRARICPAFSLPDLLAGAPGQAGASKLTAKELSALLKAIPPYFSAEVITPDHRVASLAFGIRLMPLATEQKMIAGMRAMLHPPAGVHATLVGLPVLAASADAAVASSSGREMSLLAGLAAVAVVLLLAFAGQWRRALAPVLPVVLASGWSGLLLYVVGIPLNPMSVSLGVLVIAISTELSVLLSERYWAQRRSGRAHAAALHDAYRSTGVAVACSGVTAIIGFAILVLSDIEMLRNFGLVTIVDLSVSLLGVVIVLPAALTICASDALGDYEREASGEAQRSTGALLSALARRPKRAGHEQSV